MLDNPRTSAIYFQNMQQRFHVASLRAIKASELTIARVFQRKAAACHVISVQYRDMMHLTAAAERR